MGNGRISEKIEELRRRFGIVGRKKELEEIFLAYYAGKNILIEGETGTGKTTLARAFAAYMDKNFYRVDGSEDVLSHVLVGYFDPPLVIAKGYIEEAFIYGPLAKAMRDGGILFINELNRLPESTQNVLLSALDEGYLDIPKLRPIKARPGFFVITTMNPSAHVGVSNLGEALKDRFVWIYVDYQSEKEEREIIMGKIKKRFEEGSSRSELPVEVIEKIAGLSARIINLTRNHKDLRRGASVRAGIDLGQIMAVYLAEKGSILIEDPFWYNAAYMALSTKIEVEDGADRTVKEIIDEIVGSALRDF